VTGMKPRTKTALLVLLLSLGSLYRLFAAYPITLGRFAPASSALQALHILDGWRPLFYSGQAWMGPAGAYLLAAMFKLFGASSLTLGLFSWVMSALFLLATVLLAHRLFGIDNALVTAALFLVPIDYLMQLAGQPRAHYTVIFVLVPAVFLATLSLLRRHREGRPLPLRSFAFGLLCGFSFWTNMAIGPAIGVAMLLLLWHLRRAFFTRVLVPWVGGWVVGLSPVIWYNLTNEAILSGQVNAENTRRLGRVLKAFATNAWPRFWGVEFGRIESGPLRALFVAALVWVAALYAWALVQGLLRWRRREEVLGYQLAFGYLILHLAVTAVSSYGNRFETGTPLSYVGTLYAVAFCIPGLVLQSRLPRAAKALALLPLGLFVANNVVMNAAYPKDFFAAIREHGLSKVTRYPNEANPYLQVCRERAIDAGYLGRAFRGDPAKYENFRLNLECFGKVTFADLSGERYVGSALAVDGARRICWIGIDRGGLRMIGATARMEPVGQFEFCSEFHRDARETTVIPVKPAGAEPGRAGVAALVDKNYDSLWQVGPQEIDGAALEVDFERRERLREIVLFPADAPRSPESVIVEVSDDGASWRPAVEVSGAVPMFWSVWHPYLKRVKPRMEIVLPRAEESRFCRLRFAGSRNRAGLAIREALFLRDGEVIEPAAWEREIDDVVRVVRERGRGAVVVGDHWFVNFFRRQGFATDYISNDTVTDTGNPNPNLIAPVALDFSRPQLLIVPRAFLAPVEVSLRGGSVPFSRTELRHHVLLLTEPARVDPPLFWNGLELNRLARRPG
jgi:4-amino-4-deoxy-L-arabinose transferase-like glycosyltransferase